MSNNLQHCDNVRWPGLKPLGRKRSSAASMAHLKSSDDDGGYDRACFSHPGGSFHTCNLPTYSTVLTYCIHTDLSSFRFSCSSRASLSVSADKRGHRSKEHGGRQVDPRWNQLEHNEQSVLQAQSALQRKFYHNISKRLVFIIKIW